MHPSMELRECLLFNPSKSIAVNCYLPLLVAGKPLHPLVQPLIHHADIYACDPEVLAARFDHVPQRRETGDRYFFTPCKRLKGKGNRNERTVGDGSGTWVGQHTYDVEDEEGFKVGEHRTLVFKKNNVKTNWLMDEYRFCPCPPEALVAGAEMVLCKIHIHLTKSKAKKRPPPVPADRPCVKKMRPAPSSTALVVHPDRSLVFAPSQPPAYAPPPPAYAPPPPPGYAPPPPPAYAPPPPPSPVYAPPPPPAYVPLPTSFPLAPSPAPAAPDGDDGDQSRFMCTMDELLGLHRGEFDDNVDMAPAEAEQQMPVLASDDNVDMSQFAASLDDVLCETQEEETPPVDDDEQQAEQQLTDSLEEEFDMSQFASSLEDDLCKAQEEEVPPVDDVDMSQFAASLEDVLCEAQDEEAPPVDDEQPAEQQLTDSLDDEFDMAQFAASLEDDLCKAQDEEAPPADEQPTEQQLTDSLEDEFDMSQFAASLEADLCEAQDKEAPPANDDEQPDEQQLPVLVSALDPKLTDSLDDEFGFTQEALPENTFPMIDDRQELNDFSNFMSYDGMFGGCEQQLPILVSDDDGVIPALEEAENIDIDKFVTSLQEEEKAPPVDDEQPAEHQLTHTLEDEFSFIQEALPENTFLMIDDDLQDLNDFSNFMLHDSMFGGSEQLPILLSDDEDCGILPPEEAENMDIDQFVTSSQKEEAPLPEQQVTHILEDEFDMPLPDPFTNAEFNELLSHVRIDEDVVLSQEHWDFIQGELDDFTLEGHT